MKYLSQFFQALLLVALVSCGSDDGGTPSSTLSRIEIQAEHERRLDINETVTLTVNGFDANSQAFTITATISWSSDNSNASVDQNGLVTGLAVGTSTITATVEGKTATYLVTVWDSSAPRTEIYVSDAGNLANPPWQILKFDEQGENPEVFISDNLAWPQDIVFLEDRGEVLISNLNSGTITRYNANTGAFLSNFATGISGPTRMKIGSDNLLYVLQWQGNGLVLRYQLDGTFVDQFTSVSVSQSIGMDWDSQGNLYVSSFNNTHVRKFDGSGNDLGLFVNTGLSGPTNIWFEAGSGDLMVNDWSGASVKRFDANGNLVGTVITGVGQVEGIAIFDNGDILIGHGINSSVKRYDSDYNFITDFISNGSGGLIKPNAVVIRKVN